MSDQQQSARLSGFLNVDKPVGMTSHDVVAVVRRALRVRKAGHAGTLDPLATGVLVVCLGSATRLSEYVMASTKHYRARVRLGVETDTYDAEGKVLAVRDASSVTLAAVEQALEPLRGEIVQVPPMYSAVKQGGRKLYELARAGETAARAARPVFIEKLTITAWTPPIVTLDIVCSAGTYVRSLANDLGAALGVGAHLAGLVRLASGAFKLEDAAPLEALLADPEWTRHLIPPSAALVGWPVVELDAGALSRVLRGQALPDSRASVGVLAQGCAPDGELAAVLQGDGTRWRPIKVFAQSR
ncbi:MAG: tRNA pseudouridine(55) synthase TruB [Aggregatilineales bacterium]